MKEVSNNSTGRYIAYRRGLLITSSQRVRIQTEALNMVIKYNCSLPVAVRLACKALDLPYVRI